MDHAKNQENAGNALFPTDNLRKSNLTNYLQPNDRIFNPSNCFFFSFLNCKDYLRCKDRTTFTQAADFLSHEQDLAVLKWLTDRRWCCFFSNDKSSREKASDQKRKTYDKVARHQFALKHESCRIKGTTTDADCKAGRHCSKQLSAFACVAQ